MNPAIIASLIFGGMGFIVGITSLLTFASNKRRTAVDEGKHLASIDEIRKDLHYAYDKIRRLEEESRGNDKVLATMQADIKHLIGSVDALREAVNRRTGDCL